MYVAWGKDATRVQGSRDMGHWSFPTRQDYEKHAVESGFVSRPSQVWANEYLVTAIQRHWHARGQNGCSFAQAAAGHADDLGWQSIVIGACDDGSLSPAGRLQLLSALREAIDRPDVQIVSFLFPTVSELAEFVALAHGLCEMPEIEHLFLSTENGHTSIGLRTDVGDSVLAWIMAFGPINSFPNTRQAPVAEFAVRVKPKPPMIFRRLNQDRAAAHLADIPLLVNERRMEARWAATLRRTRAILGGEPDAYSAAKVTFTVPSATWTNVHRPEGDQALPLSHHANLEAN